MKRIMLVVLTGVVISGLSWGQTLSGTYTIAGSSPNYATISLAIADINSATTITGNVTFFIQGDISSEPGGTITSSLLNSSDRIVFRPSGSTRSVLLDAPIVINSSYVTIDGSLTEGGTSQNLKFGLNTGGDGTYIIGITGFVSNDSVKHCELGVSIGSAGDYAIKVDGINTKSSLVLDSLTLGGSGKTNGIVYLHNLAGTNVVSNCTINGNAISNAGAAGIRIGTASGTLNITKTKIHAVSTSGGGGLFGIDNTSASSGALNLYNNMIGGNFSASGSPSSYILLNLNGGGAKKAYHNTLVLSSITGLGSNTGASVALIAGTLDLENNILVNHVSAGFASCILFFTLPSAITSNYNCVYKSGTGNIGDDGSTTYSTLGGWQTGTSKDPNSVSFAPALVSTSDLHLQGQFVLGGDGDEQLTGTNLSGSVSDDIDGDARRFGTQTSGTGPAGPYMGADESTNELPIQLTAITVTSNRLDAVLRWSTATEVNNHGFEVERRSVGASTGSAWEKVGFVSGSGTSSSPKDYSYIDAGLPAGRYAYRIKQVDNDGSFTYYLAAEVEVGVTAKVLALESNYPNPFNPSTNIAFSVPENGKVALKVFNILGQEVAVLFDGIAEAGKLYQQTFNASQFPTGLYFSRLEFGGKSLMRKMLFVK